MDLDAKTTKQISTENQREDGTWAKKESRYILARIPTKGADQGFFIHSFSLTETFSQGIIPDSCSGLRLNV